MTADARKLPRPRTCNACQLSHTPGLASSAFARHYSRNHMLFSLPDGTEMFHFPSFPLLTLYIQVRVTGHESSRVTPFGNPRITARLPAPRGLSQAPTSFIGSWCQDIHRVPLKTYDTHPIQDGNAHEKCTELKMLTSTIQFTSNEHTQTHTHQLPRASRNRYPRGTLMKDCHASRAHPFQGWPSQVHGPPGVPIARKTPWPAPSGPNSASPLPTPGAVPTDVPPERSPRHQANPSWGQLIDRDVTCLEPCGSRCSLERR